MFNVSCRSNINDKYHRNNPFCPLKKTKKTLTLAIIREIFPRNRH